MSQISDLEIATLGKGDVAQVEKIWKENARKACAVEGSDFRDCAKEHRLTAPFACRDLFKKFNDCLHQK